MLFLNLKRSAEKVFCLVKDSVLTNVQWKMEIKIEKKNMHSTRAKTTCTNRPLGQNNNNEYKKILQYGSKMKTLELQRQNHNID